MRRLSLALTGGCEAALGGGVKRWQEVSSLVPTLRREVMRAQEISLMAILHAITSRCPPRWNPTLRLGMRPSKRTLRTCKASMRLVYKPHPFLFVFHGTALIALGSRSQTYVPTRHTSTQGECGVNEMLVGTGMQQDQMDQTLK